MFNFKTLIVRNVEGDGHEVRTIRIRSGKEFRVGMYHLNVTIENVEVSQRRLGVTERSVVEERSEASFSGLRVGYRGRNLGGVDLEELHHIDGGIFRRILSEGTHDNSVRSEVTWEYVEDNTISRLNDDLSNVYDVAVEEVLSAGDELLSSDDGVVLNEGGGRRDVVRPELGGVGSIEDVGLSVLLHLGPLVSRGRSGRSGGGRNRELNSGNERRVNDDGLGSRADLPDTSFIDQLLDFSGEDDTRGALDDLLLEGISSGSRADNTIITGEGGEGGSSERRGTLPKSEGPLVNRREGELVRSNGLLELNLRGSSGVSGSGVEAASSQGSGGLALDTILENVHDGNAVGDGGTASTGRTSGLRNTIVVGEGGIGRIEDGEVRVGSIVVLDGSVDLNGDLVREEGRIVGRLSLGLDGQDLFNSSSVDGRLAVGGRLGGINARIVGEDFFLHLLTISATPLVEGHVTGNSASGEGESLVRSVESGQSRIRGSSNVRGLLVEDERSQGLLEVLRVNRTIGLTRRLGPPVLPCGGRGFKGGEGRGVGNPSDGGELRVGARDDGVEDISVDGVGGRSVETNGRNVENSSGGGSYGGGGGSKDNTSIVEVRGGLDSGSGGSVNSSGRRKRNRVPGISSTEGSSGSSTSWRLKGPERRILPEVAVGSAVLDGIVGKQVSAVALRPLAEEVVDGVTSEETPDTRQHDVLSENVLDGGWVYAPAVVIREGGNREDPVFLIADSHRVEGNRDVAVEEDERRGGGGVPRTSRLFSLEENTSSLKSGFFTSEDHTAFATSLHGSVLGAHGALDVGDEGVLVSNGGGGRVEIEGFSVGEEDSVVGGTEGRLVTVDDTLNNEGLVVSSETRGSHPVGTAVPEQVGYVPERSPGSRAREGSNNGVLTNTISELLEASDGSARSTTSESSELRRVDDTVELGLGVVGGIGDGVVSGNSGLLSLSTMDLEDGVHLLEVGYIEELTTLLSEAGVVTFASRRTTNRGVGSESAGNLVDVPESGLGIISGGVVGPEVDGRVGRVRTDVRIAEALS